MLRDGIELGSSDGSRNGSSGVLKDGLDVVGVNVAVGSDEESSDSGNKRSLEERRKGVSFSAACNLKALKSQKWKAKKGLQPSRSHRGRRKIP